MHMYNGFAQSKLSLHNLTLTNIFERHHARVSEKKRGVIIGDQRCTVHTQMSMCFKIFQESFPKIGDV